jgi:hypothetical protein
LPATHHLNSVDLGTANCGHIADYREARGEALFAKVSELDFSKQANSVYKVGRRPEWVKIENPNYPRREALIRRRMTRSSVGADNKISRRPTDNNRAIQ